MPFQRVTLRDVAAKLGVSHTAVSLALRNHPSVSPERRRQIRQVAREMGYKPDPFLSGLAAHRRGRAPSGEHGAVAWINHWPKPEELHSYREFQGYWESACKTAHKFGWQVDEVVWPQDCSAKRLERILLARGMEGILIPPHPRPLDWQGFDWSKFTVLRIGMSAQSPDSNVVAADVFRGVVMAVKKIHEQGYRRVGFTVNRQLDLRLNGNFLSGFYYAQSWLNTAPTIPPLITFLNSRVPEEVAWQRAALQEWLHQHQPDAVLTADREIPAMIRDLGYEIPKDLAVAGTSVLDIPFVDAGMDQQPEVIGQMAVETLVKQLNLNQRGVPRDPCRILLEARWRDGKSLPRKS